MAPKAVAKKNGFDEAVETARPEEVVFYSWIENAPSSLVFHISGGEKVLTADKQIMRQPMKEARFMLGLYSTSDPESIKALDLAIERGENITRSYEKFLQKTMKPEAFAAHVANKNASLTDEIEDLKRQLAEREAQ